MTSETPYKPVAKELPLLVHITAPATLPAGYTFEAEINGDPSKLFTCEVVRYDYFFDLEWKHILCIADIGIPFSLSNLFLFAFNNFASRCFNEQPEGGVQEGQVFLAPLPKNYAGTMIEAPTGQWKDGLGNCFTNGICHPSLWCAFCCHSIAIGQVRFCLVNCFDTRIIS